MLNRDSVKQIVEYIQVTGEVIDGYQEKVAKLETDIEKARALTKTASKEKPEVLALDKDQVSKTVDGMAKAKFIKKAEREDMEARIMENPALLLECLDKLATEAIEAVPTLGKTASHDPSPTSSVRESDLAYEQAMLALHRKL